MKKVILATFLTLNFLSSFAQKEDRNWVFADSIGIDFNNLSTPQLFFTHSSNNEACATISDKYGNRIFYIATQTLGGVVPLGQIFNKEDKIIENGDGLFFYYSSTNGSIFLPFPDDTLKYYCFHLSYDAFSDSNQILYYSIIDKTLDSGRGKVIQKNIYLADSISEQVIAIKHGNGRDWWLLARKIYSDTIIKFLVTPTGIVEKDIQQIGNKFYTYPGENAASRDGNHIAYVCLNGNIELMDFDRCSGELSNFNQLGTPPFDSIGLNDWNYYGCAFSQDGNRLYIGRNRSVSLPDTLFSSILQFSVTSTSIQNSKTEILPQISGFNLDQFELAPDNKIYITGVAAPNTLDSSYKFLSVIETPNDSSLSCNLNLFSFYLGNRNSKLGLPNMPNYNLGALHESECDTIDGIETVEIKNNELISLYPNPANNKLVVELGQTQNYINEIEISDAVGRVLLKMNKLKRNKIELDIRDLSSGIYFIQIKTGDKFTIKKFVKM